MMKKTTAWVAIALMMAGCSSNGNDNDQRFVVCPVDHEIQLTRGDRQQRLCFQLDA